MTVSYAYITLYLVHATIYGRGQMVIPAEARKQAGIDRGDVVSVEPDGDGRIVLVRLEKPVGQIIRKARITYRKGKHAVGSVGRSITSEQVRAVLSDFP